MAVLLAEIAILGLVAVWIAAGDDDDPGPNAAAEVVL